LNESWKRYVIDQSLPSRFADDPPAGSPGRGITKKSITRRRRAGDGPRRELVGVGVGVGVGVVGRTAVKGSAKIPETAS
jgi:hypothetical protein